MAEAEPVTEEFNVESEWVEEKEILMNLKDEGDEEMKVNTTYLQDVMGDKRIDYHMLFEDNTSDENADRSLLTFDEMAKKMVDVSNGEKILFKKIITQGDGIPMPLMSLAIYHYRFYFECSDEPFDSSYALGAEQKHRLNSGVLVQGVDMALNTMSKGERALFIIKAPLMFGEVGCQPRIPRNADVLADIQLQRIIPPGTNMEFFDLTREERRSLPFSEHLKVAVSCRKAGNDFFRSRRYANAARQYYQAIDVLAHATVLNDEEDGQRTEEELKVKNNLSQTAQHLGRSRLCIRMCNDVLRLEPNNAKAIYRKGKALTALAEFDAAAREFQRVLKMDPGNNDVLTALEANEQQRSLHSHLEKTLYQRMFS